jgi:hypothetical protein
MARIGSGIPQKSWRTSRRRHLGELTQCLPFELVDDVLEQTPTRQARLRMFPPRVGVYFTLALALALFPALGYAGVWDKLTAGLYGLCLRPTEKSLRHLHGGWARPR